MRPVFFILLLITICGHSQESSDIKYHVGSDAATFNTNSLIKSNIFLDPKARARDAADTKSDARIFSQSKETQKRMSEMAEARKHAFENLRSDVLAKPSGRLVRCNSCDGSGTRVCTKCNADRFIECTMCHGSPNQDCRACRGDRLINFETCKTCNGSGKSECKFCSGKPVICSTCMGVGDSICPVCSGAGSSFQARVDIDVMMDSDTSIDRRSTNTPHRDARFTPAQEDSILTATRRANKRKLSKQKKDLKKRERLN